ncbi:sigma-70 family RNA polymerase sigma factor [Isosphaeraceae bacterium EP7]
MGHGSSEQLLRQVGRLFAEGTSAGISSTELLERYASRRDEAAFEGLVARHGPMVLGVCRRMLRDPRDVDDAFQATFLILARKASSLRDPGGLAPWLHGVSTKVAARARSLAIRRGIIEPSAGELMTDLPSSDRSSPGAEWAELRRVLDEEIARLPENDRTPLILCGLEGLSRDEAARRLGWPPGTVAGRLARAREKLRGRLTRRGMTLPASAGLALVPESLIAAVPPALQARAVLNLGADLGTVTLSSTARTLAKRALSAMALTESIKLSATFLVAAGVLAAGVGAVAQGVGPAGRNPEVEPARPIARQVQEPGPAIPTAAQDATQTKVAAEGAGGANPEAVSKSEGVASLLALAEARVEDLSTMKAKITSLIVKDLTDLEVDEAHLEYFRKRMVEHRKAGEEAESKAQKEQYRREQIVKNSTYGPTIDGIVIGRRVSADEAKTPEGRTEIERQMTILNAREDEARHEATESERNEAKARLTYQNFAEEVSGKRRDLRDRERELDRLEHEHARAVREALRFKVSAEPRRIGVGDTLEIAVLQALPGRPINGERIVREDGTISLGYYGEVQVAGLTRIEAKVKVVTHLTKSLSDELLGLVEEDGGSGKFIRIPPGNSSTVFLDDSKAFTDEMARDRDDETLRGEIERLRRIVNESGNLPATRRTNARVLPQPAENETAKP